MAFNGLQSNWRLERLADVFDIQLGKMLSGKARAGISPKPYLRNRNVQWGSLDTSEIVEMDFNDREMEKFRLRNGDLLMCEGGEPGRTAIWRDELTECYYQKAIHRLRPLDGRTLPEFFLYWFRFAFDITNIYGISGASSTIAHLPLAQLRSLSVPVPPMAEQRQIALALSAVQRAIDRQERLIALTTELKKALMHQLFTEGTRGEPLKQTVIGPVPANWKIRRMVDLLREPVRNGHSAKETTNPDGIRTLTLTAITRADFSTANTKTTVAVAGKVRNLWLEDGDIFIQRANTLDYVGLAALYEGPKDFAIFPDLLVRIRLREDQMLPKVLTEYLITPRCRRYFRMNAKGTAGNFPKIDQGIIENLQMPVPPRSEQLEIEHAARTLDRKKAAHLTMRKGHDELFRTLLHQLMTAQVSVHDLDLSPLDEPAVEPAGVT